MLVSDSRKNNRIPFDSDSIKSIILLDKQMPPHIILSVLQRGLFSTRFNTFRIHDENSNANHRSKIRALHTLHTGTVHIVQHFVYRVFIEIYPRWPSFWNDAKYSFFLPWWFIAGRYCIDALLRIFIATISIAVDLQYKFFHNILTKKRSHSSLKWSMTIRSSCRWFTMQSPQIFPVNNHPTTNWFYLFFSR